MITFTVTLLESEPGLIHVNIKGGGDHATQLEVSHALEIRLAIAKIVKREGTLLVEIHTEKRS